MLTDRQIQLALKNVATEVTLNDGARGRSTGSLKLVVRRLKDKSVAAIWYGTWKADGQRAKKALGRYPDLTLALARQKFASEVSPLVQARKNPKAAATVDGKPTVERLFKAYMAHLRANGARTADEIERVLLTGKWNVADGIGRHRLAGDIEAADISAHLASTFARGARRQADIERTCTHAAFQWGAGAAHDYRTTERRAWGLKMNPVALVPRDSEASQARERNLTADELRQVWHALDAGKIAPEVAGAIRLLICTGQRVRETLRADGGDFDLTAGLWNMPGHKTKLGVPHTVPLPRQAVEVVRQLIALHGAGPLFPSRKGASTPTIKDTSLQHALRRWSRRAGLADFQTKDLRRTWKSRAGEAGVDLFMRDMIQMHAKSDTSGKHYDHTDYLPKMRVAMRTWEAWLDYNVVNKQQHKIAA